MSSISVITNPVSASSPSDSLSTLPCEVARANLYYLLSKAFTSPQEMDKSLPGQLRQLIPDLKLELQTPAHSLADAWENALKDREILSLAYARLFLGPFEILAPPYASFYLEQDQRLMGPVSQEVASFYSSAGLGPGDCPREAPDHAALEWEFMYYLTYQFATTGEKHWLDQRECFTSAHLSLWMPPLAEAIARSSEKHSFYQALAVFLSAMMDNLEAFLL